MNSFIIWGLSIYGLSLFYLYFRLYNFLDGDRSWKLFYAMLTPGLNTVVVLFLTVIDILDGVIWLSRR